MFRINTYFTAFILLIIPEISFPGGYIIILDKSGLTIKTPIESNMKGYNKRIHDLASEIQSIDYTISHSSKMSKKEIEFIRILRDAAVKDLYEANEIVTSTSGSKSPTVDRYVDKGRDLTSFMKEFLNKPKRLGEVETDITATKGVLHYVRYENYSVEPSWQSYTKGDKLLVGLYKFLVTYKEGGKTIRYVEEVLIKDSPTTKIISPM